MTTTVNGTNGATTNGQHSSWQAKHQVPSHFIGGNHLDAAPPSAVKDFVQNSDGHSVITSVSLARIAQVAYQVLM
jgi:acetyl-CoA carboxylase/biotin carboxylase 1